MALLCIKVAPASGMFPLSPAAAAAVLQDSELQDLLDFASKSDQQHPHHPSPRLNSKDWNHTTVKNVSNETVRKDLLFKGMNQALLLKAKDEPISHWAHKLQYNKPKCWLIWDM